MKQYSIRNSLDCEVGLIETSFDEDFAVALYAVQTGAKLKELRRIGYSAKLRAILL